MNIKYLMFVLMFLFVSSSYAAQGTWTRGDTTYSSLGAGCAAVYPAISCSRSVGRVPSSCPSGWCGIQSSTVAYAACQRDIYASCANDVIGQEYVGSFTFTCSASFIVTGTAPNYSCRCPDGKGEVDGVCQTCPSGQVINPYTQQCQQPCNSDDWSNTLMLPSGSTLTPSPYTNCVNGCEYQHKLLNPGACVFTPGPSGTYLTDEMHCVQMQSRSTGQFCSGGSGQPPVNPPSDCPDGYTLTNGACVPDCPSNQEKFNGQCLPSCGPNSTRNPDGSCACIEGNHLVQGQCQPDPTCEQGQVLFNHQCVQPCAQGEIRSETGQCLPNCPSGYALLNGNCVPSGCPSGQHLDNGQCVNNPPNPNCGKGEVANPNGQCVPNCPPGTALVNGQCTNPSCPSGQTYSTLTKSCVTPDKQCPVGTHQEGFNCVTDQPPDKQCPAGTTKQGDLCVSTQPPGLSCPAGTTLNNGKCESNEPPDKSCPSGQHKDGDQCIDDNGPQDKCPIGFTKNGDSCESDEPPVEECPQGQTDVGGSCKNPDGSDSGDAKVKKCPVGLELDGDKCVGSPPAPECPKDMQLTDGKCVSVKPPILTCPTGQHLDGDKCVTDGGPTIGCKSGFKKVGDQCVLIDGPSSKCPASYMLIGDKCVLAPPAGGGGGGTTGGGGEGEGDGGGECDPSVETCGGGGGSPAGVGDLYTSKGKKFSAVMDAFSMKVQASKIAQAGSKFFTAPSYSSTCPVWAIPSTDYFPAIHIDIQCSPEIVEGFRIAGLCILIVCAYAAMRMALL